MRPDIAGRVQARPVHPPGGRPSLRNARIVTAAYYILLLALLALIVPKLLGDFLPRSLAHHIGADSEGYLLAVLLAAWIQGVRPMLTRRRGQWPVTLAAAAVSAGVGVYLYNADLLGTVKTLNETFLALAVLIPYVQLRRPLPGRAAAALPIVLVVLVVAAEHTAAKHLTTALAEGVVMVLIAPVVFDLADRGILDASRPTSSSRRLALWIGLIGAALLSIALRHFARTTDLHDVIDYGARAQEAWVAMLLISIYFSLQRAGSSTPAGDRPTS